MSRRKKNIKKNILPDPKFCNIDVAKFVNILMFSGKKSLSENIIYRAFDYIKKKTGRNPLDIFFLAIENCKPLVEVKSRRIGGSSFQVPIEVRLTRRATLSMRWLRESLFKRKEKYIYHRLGQELIDASENKGFTIKKRDNIHKMAEANKTFSHFKF
ncbi:30S ribosomal protein S7 [Candidatus Zinderia endosymbiont of Aphrophora alni]|uniref:30S ribosomal protein S7 n=1 Tax=Candidatus Zinderia endosymbiont of Aphrophora alni TaxID=3077951 RepID=UPI0030CA9851